MSALGLQQSLRRHPLAWASATYGLLVYLTLPSSVVVLNDDFGYLRSIVETLRRGRPWTDDWLEPWAASLSVFSALAFKLTGSFHAGVQGLQAVYASAALAGAWKLFRDRGLSVATSTVAAWLLVSFPTLLWKSLEFTGVALYLPCLLWAIWSAGQRRWGIFFIVWLIACASRQSAVAWLALPAWTAASGVWQDRKRLAGWGPPALVVVAAGVAFTALSMGMNPTQSQAMITDQVWQRIAPAKSLAFFGWGVGALMATAGLSAFAHAGRAKGWPLAARAPRTILVVVGAAVVVSAVFAASPEVYHEHGSYANAWGTLHLRLLAGLALTGWLVARFAVRGDLLFAGAASLLLACVRPAVWDYYFIDAALFVFFSLIPRGDDLSSVSPLRWPRGAEVLLVAVLAVFQGTCIYRLRSDADRVRATVVLAETAMRRGALDVTELSFAPMAFAGWHLHPHFVAHEGRRDADIGGFLRYLRPGAIEVRRSPTRFWSDSRSLRPIEGADAERVIESGVFRVGWIWHQRFTLLRSRSASPAPALPLDRATFSVRRFPLNDDEWRTEVRGRVQEDR